MTAVLDFVGLVGSWICGFVDWIKHGSDPYREVDYSDPKRWERMKVTNIDEIDAHRRARDAS